MLYEVFFIEKNNFDDCEYESPDINKILKKISKNKGYNLRINPDEPCIVYGDLDKTTLIQLEGFLKFFL